MIKVLWLEDEEKLVESFRTRLMLNDIEAVWVQTAADFKTELERNYKRYDAAILDVMGFVSSVEETPTSQAFRSACEVLTAINMQKTIPFFVYSAQLERNENLGLRAYIGEENIYIKGSGEDNLIDTIKRVVSDLPEIHLKNKYAELFNIINSDQLFNEHFDRIFNLIKWAETNLLIDDTEDNFTRIRKVLETIFKGLGQQGLIPEQIFTDKGWINGSSHFLDNKHWVFEQKEPYIHPTIVHVIKYLLDIIQDASHSVSDNLKLKVGNYLQENNRDYLFKSCINQLFEIIFWYKKVCSDYPDTVKNKRELWQIKDNIKENTFELKKDEAGNYYCGPYLLTYTEVKKKGYKKGDSVIILDERTNKNLRTREEYEHIASSTMKYQPNQG